MAVIQSMTPSSPVLSSPVSGVTTVRQGMAQANLQVAASQSNKGSMAKPSSGEPSLRDVQQAVKQANVSLAGSNESISFGYEEKLGQLVVQVSDKNTGRVISQFPSKDFIQFQIHMREMVGLLLDKQA